MMTLGAQIWETSLWSIGKITENLNVGIIKITWKITFWKLWRMPRRTSACQISESPSIEIMWVKQCHKPSIWEAFIPPIYSMLIWGMGYDWFSPIIWTSSTKWRTDVLCAILECPGGFGGDSPSSHNPKSGESILWVPQELVRSEKNQHSDPH
jgi:hypothetical protein